MEPHLEDFETFIEKNKHANLSLQELANLYKPNIDPLPDEDDEVEEQEEDKFCITLKLFYKKTYNSDKYKSRGDLITCSDPHCFCFSEDTFDIDKFMKYDDNYINFIECAMDWYECGDELFDYIKDFEYIDGGIVKFKFYPTENFSKEIIMSQILYQPFEDFMYESPPGSDGVIALNRKCETNYEHIELGLIDCRDKRCIRVKRIK